MSVDAIEIDETKFSNRLNKLIEANQSLAAVESLERLVPRLLNLAREVTSAEASSFLIYDAEKDVLKFASVKDEVIGDTAEQILKDSFKLKMGEGIAGWVAKERKPLNIEDAQKDSRFFSKADKSTGFVTRTLLCVPVLHKEELLGVIEVLNAKDKPCFDLSDQELLISFANLAAVAIIRARLLEERLNQQKVQIQMETAAKIQSLFWPKPPDIGFGSHIWAVSLSAGFVGGDLYDMIPMPDGSWLIYVADVSDKGLPAAMVMVALWSRIRSEALLYEKAGELLGALNTAMFDLLAEEGFFASIILGKYWPRTGQVELVLGGHHPAVRICGNQCESVPKKRGPSLGVISSAKFDEERLILSKGAAILLFTDGITEALNERGELFGQKRVIEFFENSSGPPWGQGLLNAVKDCAVKDWRGNAEASDDLTLLEIWRDLKI
jgi:serine phosphatase RsbU (regulator of sigma subunit)